MLSFFAVSYQQKNSTLEMKKHRFSPGPKNLSEAVRATWRIANSHLEEVSVWRLPLFSLFAAEVEDALITTFVAITLPISNALTGQPVSW